jgi:hypothetical protein
MADVHSQMFVVGLLQDRDGLTVRTDERGSMLCVIVESQNAATARWAYEFMLSIDVDAVLVDSSQDPDLDPPQLADA